MFCCLPVLKKDPLEKAFSTSFVVFRERVIEEFCPEAGKEWF